MEKKVSKSDFVLCLLEVAVEREENRQREMRKRERSDEGVFEIRDDNCIFD